MFASPNRRSDVILIIGDKRLHVSKEVLTQYKKKIRNFQPQEIFKLIFFQYLSVQSPVFEALFFGEFAEKGKEVVELKDVVYEVSDTGFD